MRHVRYLTPIAVAVVSICTVGCAHGGSLESDEFAPIAIQVGREEIHVLPSDDSVTVVINVQDDAAQPQVCLSRQPTSHRSIQTELYS